MLFLKFGRVVAALRIGRSPNVEDEIVRRAIFTSGLVTLIENFFAPNG
jgi:hypothetical protein